MSSPHQRYDKFQQSLPSITSLLGKEPQPRSLQRRRQYNPITLAQARYPRLPSLDGGINARSQVLRPGIGPCGEPASVVIHEQNPFYPLSTHASMTPGTEMMPTQPQYPFDTGDTAILESAPSHSPGILQSHSISTGTFRAGPHPICVSEKEDDKRRRAARASALFRIRKKIQEEKILKEIKRLEGKIEDLKKEYALQTAELILDVTTGVTWRSVQEQVGHNPFNLGTVIIDNIKSRSFSM